MARRLEFDRAEVLQRAIDVFWRKGFAATSTDDLLQGMGVGRQSMYNTFGDKRTLYLEVLGEYQKQAVAEHLARLDGPDSARDGIRALLTGIAAEDDLRRSLGCLGVGSVGEFGATDDEVLRITQRANRALRSRVVSRVREGQAAGELDAAIGPEGAADFILMTMTGLQVAARSGATLDEMRNLATFASDRLTA